jgi:hypothetical protein
VIPDDPNLNDQPNDDNEDHNAFFDERAQVLLGLIQELEERAASELGLYAERSLPLQVIPGTNDWACQFAFQIGERAYRKLHENDLDANRLFQGLEVDMIADELLRDLREEEEGGES